MLKSTLPWPRLKTISMIQILLLNLTAHTLSVSSYSRYQSTVITNRCSFSIIHSICFPLYACIHSTFYQVTNKESTWIWIITFSMVCTPHSSTFFSFFNQKKRKTLLFVVFFFLFLFLLTEFVENMLQNDIFSYYTQDK